MKSPHRSLSVLLWALLALTLAGVLGAKLLVRPHADLPVLYVPAAFSLVDQDGRPCGSETLKGRPYVADFIFTSCGSICPKITQALAGLQGRLPGGVHLVSFSVDPVNDTPAVLKRYAADYKADETRWHFLTGQRAQAMQVIKAFQLPFEEASTEGPIFHSKKLVLVDAGGSVRGLYDSNDAEALQRLVADAGALVKEPK